MDERYARITCACGIAFQVLKEENEIIDWDEIATRALYGAHLNECEG